MIWVTLVTATLSISATNCSGQQFRDPRFPASAPPPTQMAGSYQVQYQAPVQVAQFQHQPQANFQSQPVAYEQSPQRPPGNQRYAPPVHISPGNRGVEQPKSIFPRNPPLQLVTTPRYGTDEAAIGLQDRIAQALTQKNNSPAPAADHSRQVVHANHLPQSQQRQYVPDSSPFMSGVVLQQPSSIRQTSMQEPVRDPFGDQYLPPPRKIVRPGIRDFQAPESARSAHRIAQQQVSILNKISQQEAEDAEIPAEHELIPPDSFAYTDDPSFQQENEFSPQPDLDSGNLEASPLRSPPTTSDSIPVDSSESQDSSPRQDLRNRLDELMEETENDLRQNRQSDESDDDHGSSAETTKRNARSLLDLDDDEDQDGPSKKSTPLDKSCESFRVELLDNPIRDIPLDMSPPASDIRNRSTSLSRNWTDQSGNVIATGSMADLRRGYVILDSGQKIAVARLSEADLAAVADYWQLPIQCNIGNRGSVARCWQPQTFTWTASSLCHKPLYFENIQLERYGHSHGPISQPFHSVAHFFVSLATLPYQTAISPANECEYSLGLFRPGDCAPWLQDPIPISLDGSRRQVLVATGLALIP